MRIQSCTSDVAYVAVFLRRYALAIGGKSVFLVVFFTVLLYLIAKPIALFLDLVLGEEMGTVHNTRQLVQLVRFHEKAKVRWRLCLPLL